MYFVDREPARRSALLRTAVIGTTSYSNHVPEYLPADTISLDLPNFDERPSVGMASSTWYRHTFDAPAATKASGVCSFRICAGTSQSSSMVSSSAKAQPMVRPFAEFRVPLYFEFPASMLHAGANTIDIHAVSDRLGSWFAPFYLGPSHEVKPAFDLSALRAGNAAVRDDRGSRCGVGTLVRPVLDSHLRHRARMVCRRHHLLGARTTG